MTPKSLLRHPKVVSSWDDFTKSEFLEAIDDEMATNPEIVTRIICCSGKIYYDLLAEREKAPEDYQHVAVVRIEQLYPFPEKWLSEIFAKYKNAKQVYWTQEEPQNMGPWYYIRHRLEHFLSRKFTIEYVGRKGSGTTAEGSGKAHAKEQERIVKEALRPDGTESSKVKAIGSK
jgi:2-oxoglutarate dehydrogenase complex dehydrogenase (E1) component-like enzyme